MRMMTAILAPLMLACLTACERGSANKAKNDRESHLYQSAMNDYTAGRLDAAVKGFRAVVAAEPANASARFQLGSLLQDHAKDSLGAFCAYTEYLSQQPDSDKARVAKARLALCEKDVAEKLAVKYGLTQNEKLVKENAAARAELGESVQRAIKLQEDLMKAMQRIAALNREVDRLKSALHADDGEMASNKQADEVKTAKALLDGDDEKTDRVTQSSDITQLRIEEAGERALSSPLLPTQPADAKAQRAQAERQAREAAQQAKPAPKGPLHETKPPTYTVQEGDTLYKIALRFYGRVSAWRAIRNANKTKISVDGRVKVGDTLRLP